MLVNDENYTYILDLQHDTVKATASIVGEQLLLGGRILYESREGEVGIYGDVARPDGKPRIQFPFNRKRSFLPDIEARPDNTHIIAFRAAVGELWLIKHNPARLEPTTAEEGGWLERDGRNFASWFRGVLADRPEVGNLLNEALRPAMHGLLIGAFDRPALAFLDEPEIGLAPHEMQPWLAQAMAALEDGQLLVISHHPAVVDYLAPERTLRFSRPRGGPTRIDEVTLETTGGVRVSEWLSRSWAYEDEHVEPET